MGFEWIVIEMITVLVECFAMFYFLRDHFEAKYDFLWLDFMAFFVIVLCGGIGRFFRWPPHIYDVVLFVLLFVYLFLFKEGFLLQKMTGVLLVAGISMAVSLVGAGIAALMTNATYQQTLETRDMTRLLALIFTKMMQITVLYVLTKKQQPVRSLKRKPILALCSMAFLNFVCLLFIWYYVQTPGMDNQQHHTHRALIWIAACLLIQLIALFVMYELFIEENISLSARLQRAELEQEKRTLQTGNLILDAVVSSKLWLAQSKGIEASIQVVSLGKERNILIEQVQLDESRTCVYWNDYINLPSDTIYEYGMEK